MPVTLALRRVGQEDGKCEAILGYINFVSKINSNNKSVGILC